MRLATIDLGTNTFHLLVAEVAGGRLRREVYRERRYVRLGEGFSGADAGARVISEAARRRGLEALRQFRAVTDRLDVKDVRVVGTAALRTAANAAGFVAAVREQTGFTVRIISGEREAELIARGVLTALPVLQQTALIMDIGGGSTEFILVDPGGVRWQRSFAVGLIPLSGQLDATAAPRPAELAGLRAHLRRTLAPLAEVLQRFPNPTLVGAAGTFELFTGPTEAVCQPVATAEVDRWVNAVLPLSLAERLAHPAIPDERAPLVTTALVLIDEVIRLARPSGILVTRYALKEGVLLADWPPE